MAWLLVNPYWVEALSQEPTTIKELCSFVGAVTFYRDMFPRRSDILTPLSQQTGKKQLTWTPECDAAFKQIKATIARKAFLKYPDHNKPFLYQITSDPR